MALIDADEAKKRLRAVRDWFCGYPGTEQDKLARSVAKMCIKELEKVKPADAVEVVRCKDCKHCMMCYPEKQIGKEATPGWYCKGQKKYSRPDDFCSYGERRTDNG